MAAVSLVLIYQPMKIEGNSMTPLISDHEAIAINRLVYRVEPIHRGDVVVFRYPLDPMQSFIKRIVGLPGETIQIRHGLVYVNGNRVPEPYVPSQYEDPSDFGPIQVPSGSYFVLGDRRNGSNDSRFFGTVARRLIEGRAAFAYWPIDHFGLLSTMGTTEAKTKWKVESLKAVQIHWYGGPEEITQRCHPNLRDVKTAMHYQHPESEVVRAALELRACITMLLKKERSEKRDYDTLWVTPEEI
jgi:signal peptidase I